MNKISPKLILAAAVIFMALSGCATTQTPKQDQVKKKPDQRLAKADLPTEHYPIKAQSRTDAIHLRMQSASLSPNQQRALDQIAERANWMQDAPIDVDIISSSSPEAISRARSVTDYLLSRAVHVRDLTLLSSTDQPDDIVSIQTIEYRAQTYDCNRTWENLSKTAKNATYKNFGCALSSNLAAQIADPRDIKGPAIAQGVDTVRKLTIISKYREGKITAAESDDQAKGTISDAVR